MSTISQKTAAWCKEKAKELAGGDATITQRALCRVFEEALRTGYNQACDDALALMDAQNMGVKKS